MCCHMVTFYLTVNMYVAIVLKINPLKSFVSIVLCNHKLAFYETENAQKNTHKHCRLLTILSAKIIISLHIIQIDR